MINIKNPKQVEKMRKAGALLYEILEKLKAAIKPGISTAALDSYAEELIRRNHAIPSFLGYQGFPASICASVDHMVVHGIPSDKEVLKEGQILSIDCGLILDGWHSDSAFTAAVGEISQEKQELIEVTERCFFEGVRKATKGNRIGDIGHAIQSLAESHGYGVIRDMTGHGIGRNMHEDPNVPNFGEKGRGVRLRSGMTIAVEPMICLGDWPVQILDDGWSCITRDHSACSHYEHTILIGDGLPELLSFPGFSWEEYDKKQEKTHEAGN